MRIKIYNIINVGLALFLAAAWLSVGATETKAQPMMEIFKDKNYSYLIDSLTGDDDYEKLILSYAYAGIGDSDKALKQLSLMENNYIQAAALYIRYGHVKEAAKILPIGDSAAGFFSQVDAYLTGCAYDKDDTTIEAIWKSLTGSPVEVIKSKACLELAQIFFINGLFDSSRAYLANINLFALTKMDLVSLYFLKARLAYRNGDYANALSRLTELLSLKHSADSREEAVNFMVDSLSRKLDDNQAHRLADLLKKEGFYSASVKILKNLDPVDSTVLKIAWCYLGLKKYGRAAGIFEALCDSPVDNIRAKAGFGLALCKYRQGFRVNAVNDFKNFIAEFPASEYVPRALFISGDFYQQSDPDEAVIYYQRLVDNYKYSIYYPRSLFLLGQLNSKLGYPAKTIELYSSYAREDETADLFDYWLYKITGDNRGYLDRIIKRKQPTLYNHKTNELIPGRARDSSITFDMFINDFFARVENFMESRGKSEPPDGNLGYVDSRYYCGLFDEAERELFLIAIQNDDPRHKINILRRCRQLHFDRVFFKVLDEFKIDLKHRGFTFNRDTWVRLDYPVLFKDRILPNIGRSDPYLALAVIRRESRFNPEAVSRAGALGLMQLMPATAWQMADRELAEVELFDPGLNIKLGCKYLNWLARRLTEMEVVVAAYNAGPTAAKRWQKSSGSDIETFIETITYDQSRDYSRWVMGDYFWYKHLWHSDFDGFANPGAEQ
jgi:TolA-binding protein